jgi:hypothetical protein
VKIDRLFGRSRDTNQRRRAIFSGASFGIVLYCRASCVRHSLRFTWFFAVLGEFYSVLGVIRSDLRRAEVFKSRSSAWDLIGMPLNLDRLQARFLIASNSRERLLAILVFSLLMIDIPLLCKSTHGSFYYWRGNSRFLNGGPGRV